MIYSTSLGRKLTGKIQMSKMKMVMRSMKKAKAIRDRGMANRRYSRKYRSRNEPNDFYINIQLNRKEQIESKILQINIMIDAISHIAYE